MAGILGLCCALFSLLLKVMAEGTEEQLFRMVQGVAPWLLLVMPLTGLFLVFVITKKIGRTSLGGIREVLDSQTQSNTPLKPTKAILHFFTGITTVIFGGSTGIEVSSVVGSSSLGSWFGLLYASDEPFRRKLIVAGAAAGIAGLFNSPWAGVFFAVEVLMITFSWELIFFVLVASFAAFGVRSMLNTEPQFITHLHGWKYSAVPFYMVFSVVAAIAAVYLTKTVISVKSKFALRLSPLGRVGVGGCVVGLLVWVSHPLYGEGYAFIQTMLNHPTREAFSIGAIGIPFVLLLVILKPLATSFTLAGGGDGGVFAPSLFLGAVLGGLFAQTVTLLGGGIIEVNFVIVGMAAILSCSLHAPLTGAFLVMSLTNSYSLAIPVMVTCFLATYMAKRIFPYTVYSYR